MTDTELISILQDLKSCKHVYAKYSDLQYSMAIEYAINKIRSHNDLSRHCIELLKEHNDYLEYIKHHTPSRDNY